MYQILPDFWKNIARNKFLRYRFFFLLVRTRCRGKSVWSIGGIKLIVETRIPGENPVPVKLCLPKILHELTWNRNRTLASRDRRLTAIFFSILYRRCDFVHVVLLSSEAVFLDLPFSLMSSRHLSRTEGSRRLRWTFLTLVTLWSATVNITGAENGSLPPEPWDGT